jgi:hypothetical protein
MDTVTIESPRDKIYFYDDSGIFGWAYKEQTKEQPKQEPKDKPSQEPKQSNCQVV